MSPELLATLFLLVGITIPAAVGGVFIFRGTYYKSLPGRVRELEADSERKDAALKRQAEELELWKGVATQTPEIQKLIELYERHEDLATTRHSMMDEQHSVILGALQALDRKMTERGV